MTIWKSRVGHLSGVEWISRIIWGSLKELEQYLHLHTLESIGDNGKELVRGQSVCWPVARVFVHEAYTSLAYVMVSDGESTKHKSQHKSPTLYKLNSVANLLILNIGLEMLLVQPV